MIGAISGDVIGSVHEGTPANAMKSIRGRPTATCDPKEAFPLSRPVLPAERRDTGP